MCVEILTKCRNAEAATVFGGACSFLVRRDFRYIFAAAVWTSATRRRRRRRRGRTHDTTHLATRALGSGKARVGRGRRGRR